MKNIFISLLVLFLSNASFAQSMTLNEQEAYITDVAKELRRELWINGYEDVDSWQEKASLELLNDHVRNENNSRYEQSLDRDEISELFKCYHRSYCEVYFVGTSSNYWGGYGQEAHFVLLYPETQKHEIISHVVYAE